MKNIKKILLHPGASMAQLLGNVLQRESGSRSLVLARSDRCHRLVSAVCHGRLLHGHFVEVGPLRTASTEARASNLRFVQNQSGQNVIRGRAHLYRASGSVHCAHFSPERFAQTIRYQSGERKFCRSLVRCTLFDFCQCCRQSVNLRPDQ